MIVDSTNPRIMADNIRELARNGGGSGLPDVTAADNGKILGVVEGVWNKMDAPSGVDYSITEQDTGIKWVDGKDIYQKTFVFENISITPQNPVKIGEISEGDNVILFNGVQVPHYNYVGDSILGHKSHMGAGSITSNVKSDKTLVVVKDTEENIETGLKKFGAMLGDFVEVGCNSVLNPGSVIGRHSNIYPTSCVRGVIPANSIYKKDGKAYAKN